MVSRFDLVRDAAEEIEDDGPEGQEAERLLAAAAALEVGVEPRAECLRSAVWWLRQRGDLDQALHCAEQAVADGGTTWVDARGDVISVLLAMDDARADEVIRELRRDLVNDPDPGILIQLVAEGLREHGREREALRWYSIGVADIDPGDIEDDAFGLTLLLTDRWHLRRELGLRRDHYDLAAERVQSAMDEERRTESGDIGLDPDSDSMLMTMLWWPEREFEALVTTWPDLAEGYGGSASGHRAQTEEHLRAHADDGAGLAIGAGVLEEFIAFAQSRDLDPRTGRARAQYAAELGRTGRATAWPPAGNDLCWCGSGTKYERCCGAGV